MRKSAKYYNSGTSEASKAKKKKNEYQKEYNKRPEERKRRAELMKERRKRGIDGKGGKDVSHTKSGRTVLENRSTNRARNGHNGRSTKK